MGLSSLPLLFLLAAAPPLEAVPVPPVALHLCSLVYAFDLLLDLLNLLHGACWSFLLEFVFWRVPF